jgi:hypothetical protein
MLSRYALSMMLGVGHDDEEDHSHLYYGRAFGMCFIPEPPL